MTVSLSRVKSHLYCLVTGAVGEMRAFKIQRLIFLQNLGWNWYKTNKLENIK